jgi:hypothetical protein
MKRFLPVAVIVALVGAILAVVVIGGGEEEGSGDSASNGGPVPINSGPVQISGGSSKDRRMAADLRDYIKPCPGAAEDVPSEAHQALKPGSRAEQRLISEYGSVEAGIEYVQRTCGSYQRITVKDGVFTVKTTLESTDTKNAADICDTIQGADLADFTPGHTVVGEDNEVLARCRARTAYEELPYPVRRRCERNPARCRA